MVKPRLLILSDLFGGKNPHKPNPKWFLHLNVDNKILEDNNHQLYLTENNIPLICNDILKSVQQ